MAPVDTVCHAICDTLRMAKELYPGKKNNLNALCERYGVDNSHRTLHGALLDAEILAEVYLAMTRGQESLIIDLGDDHSGGIEAARRTSCSSQARTQIVRRASPDELVEHEQVLAAVEQASKGQCLWLHTGTGR
jgi:DNA polymerase-3 subunit epsilon